MSESFLWKAIYRDGEVLDELLPDGSGKSAGFAAVDRARLAVFMLAPQKPGLPTPYLRVPEDDAGFEPVFFRRNRLTVNPETGEESRERQRVPVLGWRRRVNGVEVTSVVAFFDDGSVLISDDPDAF